MFAGAGESLHHRKANGEKEQFSTFDPKTGVLKPALTIQGLGFPSRFSPDGSTLAVAPDRKGRIPAEIQLYSLRDGGRTTLQVEGWAINYGIDWNPDGKSLWVSATAPKERSGDCECGPARKRNAALRRHRKPSWLGNSFAGWQLDRVLEAEH